MHVEALKKGDIVLNHLQTKQLMETGRTFGNGRMYGAAYANGTAFNGMPAHSGTGDGGGTIGGNKHTNAKKKSSSNNGNNNTNSKKNKKKSSSTSEKVSKAIEKISKWVSNLFDWIEVRIDYLSKKADSYYTKAQNAIDLGLSNPGNYNDARTNIQHSIATNNKLIEANEQGSARYMAQANTIKKKYDGKLGKKDKKSFNDAVAILNAGGKIDITKYSANVKQALEDYKKYFDSAESCKYAVDDLNSTLIEQKEALYNLPIDEATAKVEKLELALSNLNLTYARISAGKNVNFTTQNGNLEEQRINQLQQLIVQQEALAKLQNDVNSTSGTDHEIALAAYEKQLKTVADAEKEYLEQQVDNEKQKFDNVKTYYENRINLLDKEKSLREASGAYESAKDYTGQLALTNQELTNMKKQLDSSIGSGIIQIGSEEWLEMQSNIVETETSLRNMQQSARKAELQEMFERAAESVQKLIDKLQTVNGLISDDMKFDYDGKLTQSGALSMLLDSKSLEDSKKILKKYADERNNILTVRWHDKGYMGDYVRGIDTELDELLDSVDSNIKSEFSNIQSYLNSLLSTVISANEKERDSILEVVSAHKEALSRKKEYYDYDKKLKSQNKDISEVRQQMAALYGSTDKKDIAKLQQLQAKLKELQDEKDDTVKEHLYDMQTDALDQISDDISKYYEKIIAEMKESPIKASEAIAAYLDKNKISADDIAGKIADVLSQYLDPKGTNKTETDNTINNSGLKGNDTPTVSEETQQKLNNFKQLVSELGTDYGSDEMQNKLNQAMAALNQMNQTEQSYAKADLDTFTKAKDAHTTERKRQEDERNRLWAEAEEKRRREQEEAARLKAEKEALEAETNRLLASQKNQTQATQSTSSNQGNGKINVGDKITITSNEAGAWKYSNKVKKKNDLKKMLKKGASYYVGEYKKNDPFPVHLYSDKERKKPVGWVRTKWLKGYASGTRSVDGDQLAWVNENWKENGGEIIYRKSDGAMLMPLGNGDTVFSADKVQALYKMLESNPANIGANEVFKPRDVMSQIQTVNTPVNYTDSHNIIVQGDLTRDTLPDLQTILKKSSDYTQNEIRKDLVKNGMKKSFR